ncbi:serine/threonine protein kinase [Labilithrix luteola]|uniref:Serine/threonine protein kinase n=1 Tax=Labilithrix luteola TaxID=1391654 RepID=A0A0K1PYJ5_9BACT|nr:serine/threonine protein kinase [Labilithrix luteola]
MLGEGGMGYVVAATHLQLGQMVALKFMRDEVITPEYRARFMREARNTVRLKSKHVTRVHDVSSLDDGTPYMVMEYLEGTDLSELLHTHGPVPVQDACEYLIQACEALTEAHQHGIIHRDLKPANLFLTRGPRGEPVIKVLDFGVSKVLELGRDEETNPGGRPRPGRRLPDSVVTKASDLLGSPSYMSPEQIVSARDADAGSDVWSLGVILFRLISGKPPFQGNSLGELVQSIVHSATPNLRMAKPDIPAGLEFILGRCLERDRTRRLKDAAELGRLLTPYAPPIVSPSLERIALLGPALAAQGGMAVATHGAPMPMSHPPPHHHPQVAAPVRPMSIPPHDVPAWGAPGVRSAQVAQVRTDMTTLTAVLWAGLVVIVLGSSALALAKFAKTRRSESPASMGATEAPISEPLPPNVGVLPADSASPSVASPSSAPSPRATSGTRSRGVVPARSAQVGEIPATRE